MNQMIIAKMAFRNLAKNKRRTLITLFGIAFGVMLSVLFTGLQDATWREAINMSARMGFGHITVQNRNYMDEPSVANSVAVKKTLLTYIRQQPDVTAAKERVVTHGMIATAAQSVGTTVYGVDWSAENANTFEFMAGNLQGVFPDKSDVHGVVLGKELANRLNVTIGKKVVYTMTDTHGEIVSALGRVRGILTTGLKGMDSTMCLTHIDSLRNLLDMKRNEVTQLAVFIRDYRQSRALASRFSISQTVPQNADVLPWQKINPDLDGLVATKMGSAKIFEILILFLVAAGIFNTLYVSVMERLREFGILNAIGFSGGRIFLLVIFESAFTALAGLLVAVLVTVGPYAYLYHHGINLAKMAASGKEISINGVGMATTLFVDIYPEKALAIAGVAVIATLLSGLYPAWKASNVVPVESIKIV